MTTLDTSPWPGYKAADIITQGKEAFQKRLSTAYPHPGNGEPATMYELLEMFSLNKFRDLLAETGYSELLKDRSVLTVFAPVDEAFDRIDPRVKAELTGRNALERKRALIRSHLVTRSHFFGRVISEGLFEATYDMNGEDIKFDFDFRRLPEGNFGTLHSINGVKPLDPDHYGTAYVSPFPSSTLFIVSDLIIGRFFLEQKYFDVLREAGGPETFSKCSTWEVLKRAKLTRFCQALEATGVSELLKKPVAEKKDRLNVFAPVDEAFRKIEDAGALKGEELEKFVKRHIKALGNKNLLGEPFDEDS